jgi:hypothetical protein
VGRSPSLRRPVPHDGVDGTPDAAKGQGNGALCGAAKDRADVAINGRSHEV